MAEPTPETEVERQTREAIVLASIGAAGPIGNNTGAWAAKVRDISTEITLMLQPTSRVSKQVSNLRACDKPFPATILGGRVEESSTRCLVRIKAVKSKNDEPEEIRTDRTDTADGKAMLERIKTLKGHKVLIYKQMETNNDTAYRVLRHVVDLGPDPDYNPNL